MKLLGGASATILQGLSGERVKLEHQPSKATEATRQMGGSEPVCTAKRFHFYEVAK